MLFIGSIYQNEDESWLLENSKVGLSYADNILQSNIISGIEENIGKTIDIISTPNIGSFPQKSRFLIMRSKICNRGETSIRHEIGHLNLPIIKHFIIYYRLKRALYKHVGERKIKRIVIYSTYLPFLMSVMKLDKNINVVLVATDLPEYYFHNKINGFRKILHDIYNKKVYRCLSRINRFVLLTDNMKGPLKVGNRPYVVVEGMVNCEKIPNNQNVNLEQSSTKIVMYSGGLHYDYGIKLLIDAFKLIKKDNYELWICGAGEAEAEIEKISMNDQRIKFFGYLRHNEIIKMQKKATVLVNPRQSEEEYTKYSFPSKIFEYMISGNPVILRKLSCIPDEYDPFLVYFSDREGEGLSGTIQKICEMDTEDRRAIGEKAKSFVMKNKNHISQTAKILELLDTDKVI